jgi:caffeoyl-CoA O-methyltransferase
MKIISNVYLPFTLMAFCTLLQLPACAQSGNENPDLDGKVQQFLDKNRRDWRDMNVPYQDGKFLYDLIIKNKYTSALEIGTSTGHSTVWLAWAMSKTGGKVTTIEINESRHREALENLKEAGLEKYVDARLADAHQLVRELKGPFDNVSNGYGGTKDFVDYVSSLDNYKTTIDKSSSSGISVSYKKAE